jgi:hypothetical protein
MNQELMNNLVELLKRDNYLAHEYTWAASEAEQQLIVKWQADNKREIVVCLDKLVAELLSIEEPSRRHFLIMAMVERCLNL